MTSAVKGVRRDVVRVKFEGSQHGGAEVLIQSAIEDKKKSATSGTIHSERRSAWHPRWNPLRTRFEENCASDAVRFEGGHIAGLLALGVCKHDHSPADRVHYIW